jgi:hypothetical protein
VGFPKRRPRARGEAGIERGSRFWTPSHVRVRDSVPVTVPGTIALPVSAVAGTGTISVSAVGRIRNRDRDRQYPPWIEATAVITPTTAVAVVACVVKMSSSVSAVPATSITAVPAASESSRRHRKDRQQNQKFCLHAGISDDWKGSPIHTDIL